MKRTNWGILSTGTIAKKFATTISQLSECGNIIAVASRKEETAKQFAIEYQIPKAYTNYRELAEDPEIDVIYIATPHSFHYENAKLCLENGKNVLCEKSFTTNATQARELIALAREKNLFIMEAFWTKFLPAYQELHRIIKDGVIGEITHFRAQYGFAPTGARYIRKFDPQLAGGALLDIGVYAIGVAAMVLGYNPKEVHSKGIIGEYGTDTFNSIMLDYENGVTAHLITTIGSIIDPQAVVFGTKGHILLREFSALQSFQVVLDNGTQYIKDFPFVINGFEYQINEVERCLRNHAVESSVMTHKNTIDVMSLMDKIRSDWGLRFPCE
ncbi:Gfo/Idh/MocA family protein [Pelosinus sp. UFO1]|uniref:Gfo/Idh/MocA family protein n=1 Tax=Pelosinus sp. UFO1 TaxID=484770 RepID=UPI0004D0FCE5|nr:Gfo/Idh/MocA family oxidoreductase [Pelosinus sp. UFO1]AIF52270.1 Trans-1,2-dihydrobenzene-1,2-diol dehydrogenase [Pelosinus sp. UFO1]